VGHGARRWGRNPPMRRVPSPDPVRLLDQGRAIECPSQQRDEVAKPHVTIHHPEVVAFAFGLPRGHPL
jgi:hypothetical protein